MEKYIENTLTSLIDQRIIDDLEIFVVDDGGKDNTLEIAKKYAKKYPNSIFPVHKENGGYGSTVNYSIQHATGKFFKTLDGDDWFDPDGLYKLVQILKTTNADVVATETRRTNDSFGVVGEENIYIESKNELKRICDAKNLEVLGHQSLTYKTEILRKSAVKLPEHILYTDGIYMVIPFLIAETVLVTNITVYFYCTNREGQSISKESKIKHKTDQIEVLKELMTFCSYAQKKDCPNYGYIKKVVTMIYMITIKILLIQPVSLAVLREIRIFESEMKKLSEDVYYETERLKGKYPLFLRWMRKTNYFAYWFWGCVPECFKYL